MAGPQAVHLRSRVGVAFKSHLVSGIPLYQILAPPLVCTGDQTMVQHIVDVKRTALYTCPITGVQVQQSSLTVNN